VCRAFPPADFAVICSPKTIAKLTKLNDRQTFRISLLTTEISDKNITASATLHKIMRHRLAYLNVPYDVKAVSLR